MAIPISVIFNATKHFSLVQIVEDDDDELVKMHIMKERRSGMEAKTVQCSFGVREHTEMFRMFKKEGKTKLTSSRWSRMTKQWRKLRIA